MARKAIRHARAEGKRPVLQAVRRARRARIAGPLGLLVLAALASLPAGAQMQLPGAMNGQSGGAPPSEGGTPPVPAAPPKPVVIKPPGEDTIVGVTLKHDGKTGQMTFEKTGADLALTKLMLEGDKIFAPNQTCKVDVTLPAPVVARPVGRPAGANRFEVKVPVCPFVIDVLDGAALVSPSEPKCEIAAADCRVAPTGLWGPAAGDVPPARAKSMEHDRVRLETTMRTNFRALLRKAGKDRAQVKEIARDQAAFSSDREMTCRDYDQESNLGFCSTQITQARALALIAKFGDMPEGPHEKRPKARKPKAAPAATPSEAPAASPEPGPAAEGQ